MTTLRPAGAGWVADHEYGGVTVAEMLESEPGGEQASLDFHRPRGLLHGQFVRIHVEV